MKVFVPLMFIALSLSAAHADASLGDKEDSVVSDRRAMNARVHVRSGVSFKVHELKSGSGIVREYVSRDGTVFAISWRGAGQPSLDLLLGRYAKEYEEALVKAGPRRGRSAQVLRSRNIVVVKSGHMRDVRGKAYLPSALPEGVTPGGIR